MATAARYVRVLTFPTMRKRHATLFWAPMRIAAAWLVLFVLNSPYLIMRSYADDIGATHREDLLIRADRWLGFGVTPTERLQDWFYRGGAGLFEWVWIVVYGSFFFLPWLVVAYVAACRRSELRSLMVALIGTFYVSLIGFALMPSQPPWLALDVQRIATEVITPVRADPNPLAAFPSVHVGAIAVMALWLRWQGMRPLAYAVGVWTLLMAISVVYLGEHYAVDTIAGIGVAYVVLVVQRRWRGSEPANARTHPAA
jgi:membrane-associated phospholipid phosphatase